MAGVFGQATAWAHRSGLLLPLNHLRVDAAEGRRRMLRDPLLPPGGKPLQSIRADVPVDASGVASREAEVRDMPVEDSLTVDMVEEDR